VALLRASSSALGTTIDVGATLATGTGVPCGDLLLEFAAAAHHDRDDLPRARDRLRAAVGQAGLVEAALTVGAFNGLTRVADATGIALDGGTLAATGDVRAELGLDAFAGAANTAAAATTAAPVVPLTVGDLFRD
jgi:hypothetical protein